MRIGPARPRHRPDTATARIRRGATNRPLARGAQLDARPARQARPSATAWPMTVCTRLARHAPEDLYGWCYGSGFWIWAPDHLRRARAERGCARPQSGKKYLATWTAHGPPSPAPTVARRPPVPAPAPMATRQVARSSRSSIESWSHSTRNASWPFVDRISRYRASTPAIRASSTRAWICRGP